MVPQPVHMRIWQTVGRENDAAGGDRRGGFGGLAAAGAPEEASIQVVLVDRVHHQLYRPPSHRIPTAALSPADYRPADALELHERMVMAFVEPNGLREEYVMETEELF